MQITIEKQKQIAERLKEHMTSQGLSLRNVCNRITNISPATVSQIINKKFIDDAQLVSEKMWNRINAYLGENQDWVTVKSLPNFKRIWNVAKDCQKNGIARAIVGNAGLGKSITLQNYAANNPNTFYIECKEHWNKKAFLNAIRTAMGLEIHTQGITEIVQDIVDNLLKTTQPLLILDEADKMKDNLIYFFVSLYNSTQKRCGYVIAGSLFFEKRMEKSVRMNKLGYTEAFSRLGREFVKLRDLEAKDVREVCEQNKFINEEQIKQIISEVINNRHNDLRMVERKISDFKKQNSNLKAA